jgi:myo-inositol 2-dehydrogenase/D-chiro-inositol 1-dehydrogenase
MKNDNRTIKNILSSRRNFLKSSATIVGASLVGATLPVEASAYINGNDTLKIALIGCGKRGAGAALNALRADKNIKLVAMADAFRDKLDSTYNNLQKIDDIKDSIDVPEEHKFVGFDAYKHAIALADVVLLVTPPAFRPQHFEAAVNAGKHVFMEKPLASDSPGIRKILATGKLADKKNLRVQVGLQNRYDTGYRELVSRIHDGAIGDIVSSTDYYLIGPLTHIPRKPNQTEMEFQMRNWRYFNWLWAGSPAGLQIHNTDIVNWVKQSYPVRAHAMGGKSALQGPEYGDVFDHFFIEYEYADGSKLNSQIRSIQGTYNKGGSFFQGTKGTANIREGIKDLNGNRIWREREKGASPYQIEHDELFAAIRNGTPLNDTEWGAKSTMTTIMGRMAAHSGQMLEWNDALNSELVLVPDNLSWDTEPPAKPDADGNYTVPVPGQSQVL